MSNGFILFITAERVTHHDKMDLLLIRTDSETKSTFKWNYECIIITVPWM